jgi:DeoR/GlpR family transcriptional regulator of sugar metabolism
MLAAERHRHILFRVKQSGAVRVSLLAEELHVAEETIRRDLERLGADRLLVRTHGGAVPIGGERAELPLSVRETVHLELKRTIARRAAEEISDGDVIALDASSTVYELARVIPDRPLTVVTNSLAVSRALAERAAVQVIVTGGVLDAPSMSLVGTLAEESLERYNIRRVFLSCQGVDAERGLSVTADMHGRIKRKMMDVAEESCLLVDSSKFGVRALEFFARVEEVDSIITDAGAKGEQVKWLRETGARVEVAGPE